MKTLLIVTLSLFCAYSAIAKDESHTYHFRQADFGMSMKSVKKTEDPDKLVREKDDYIS